MDKRLILAKAGSGKTYTICEMLDENKNNIIISYTNNNIKNIESELFKRFGYIPKNTRVMTFHSFIYRYLIRPYERTIYKFFLESFKGSKDKKNGYKYNINVNGLKALYYGKVKGLITVPLEKNRVNGKVNSKYITDTHIGHYMINDRYHTSRLCKLPMKVKCKEKTKIGIYNKNLLVYKAMSTINEYVDYIYIDECQDFREGMYTLLIEIIKLSNNIILVGDYYQHSTVGDNNTGKPFTKPKDKITNSTEVSYDEYIQSIASLKVIIDEDTLKTSRRCSYKVCDLVREKLNIDIDGDLKKGDVQIKYVEGDELIRVLGNDNIVKLTYQNSNKYTFRAVNWGYSKGDTYDNTCIVLSKAYDDILDDNFNVKKIKSKQSTINKLYVAITRTKGDLLFVKSTEFTKYKKDYYK